MMVPLSSARWTVKVLGLSEVTPSQTSPGT
jgi:hypothetical protein